VIGVGHLGQHHARIYATLPGCRLVAVADIDEARARDVAESHGVTALADPSRLHGQVDAVSVAVPTEVHRSVATPFLEAGIAVLIEKPLARTLEDADALIGTARKAGALLAVGHTERFNPAVEALKSRTSEPRFIESHRLGSFSPRSLDIDVVLDLMIHDIDIALALVGNPVHSAEAIGVAALTPRVDIANARVVFTSGCVANLTASRISASRTRKIRVFERDSYLSCDCAQRTLEHYRLERTGGARRPSIVHDNVDVPQDEPLHRELTVFTSAARGSGSYPVTGEAGRAALELALTIAGKIEESMTESP
jgi:predicted dehydrogenase